MWPEALPRLLGVKNTVESLTTGHKIPETRAEFHYWAQPVKNPRPVDRSRGWIIAIVSLSTPKIRCELTVALQGFVSLRQLALEQAGNWNKQ